MFCTLSYWSLSLSSIIVTNVFLSLQVHFALKWDWHFMCSDGENVIEIMYHLKNCTENDCKIIKPLIEMMSNSKENNESCMEPPYVEQGDS